MARTAAIKLHNNVDMTVEINVFCFVYIHDNQLYHRVKTKTVPQVQHYIIIIIIILFVQ